MAAALSAGRLPKSDLGAVGRGSFGRRLAPGIIASDVEYRFPQRMNLAEGKGRHFLGFI